MISKFVKIEEICEMWSRSTSYYNPSEFVKAGEGAIIISPHNIVNNKINFDKVTYYSWKGYYGKTNINVDVGDILLCKYAADGTPYKSAFVEYLPEKAIGNPSLFLFKNIKCNPKYLQLVISSDEFQKKLRLTTSNGPMPAVRLTEVLKIEIPLPDEKEQERIVKKFLNYREKKDNLIFCLEKEKLVLQKEYSYYLCKELGFN